MNDTPRTPIARAAHVPLHTVERFNTVVLPHAQVAMPSLVRIRVPGGWLYSTYDYTENETTGVGVHKTTAFVPLCPDDEEGDL